MSDKLDNNLKNDNLGIQLICCLVECPDCHNDILVEIGYHCGLDAMLESIVTFGCYKCHNQIKIDINTSIIKDVKYMTISDFSNMISEELKII